MIVEFAIMLVGASGHATVNLADVEPVREIGPAKLLTLVKETDIVAPPPEFRSIGMILMVKSPTWMTDAAW